MAEPLSIASGIAGLITLSTAVLAAGYEYLNSVSRAPEEFKGLVSEIACLNTVLSQVISFCLSDQIAPRTVAHMLKQEDVLQDCEQILHKIQTLMHDCGLVSGQRGKNAVNALL